MPLAHASFPAPAGRARDAAAADGAAEASVPHGILGMLAVFAGLGLLAPNGPLTAASLLVLAALIGLLWRPGEPPLLLFGAGFQWVQVTAKVFHADVFGMPISALSQSPSIEQATWLSLAGLVVLAAGMRIATSRLPPQGKRLAESAASFTISRAFWLWAIGSVVSALILNVAWSFGGLTQILLALVKIRWAPFFWLAYLVFQRREGFAPFAVAFGVELVQGIGFFSGFKTVFFVTFLAVLATRVRLTAGTAVMGTLLVACLVMLGSAWTVVKPAFRGEISGGQGQVARGSRSSQLSTLGTMLVDLRAEDLVQGLDPMFRRIAYTDYFAATMDFVPAYRPFGRGELWGTAVKHVLQPRLLYPNKPVLRSDSEVTMALTGQFLASDGQGTSISVGYMGESYADFGPVGMFGVVFVLGLGWGLVLVAFMRRARAPLVGLGFALAILLGAYQFEMASIKLLGGVLMQVLVLLVVYRFFGTRLAAWLGAEADDDAGVDYVAAAGTR